MEKERSEEGMKEGIEHGRERQRRNGGRGKKGRREMRERVVINLQISGLICRHPN